MSSQYNQLALLHLLPQGQQPKESCNKYIICTPYLFIEWLKQRKEIMHMMSLPAEHAAFFKCTRWQIEETTNIDCRYHYFCDSDYPEDYPPIVDLLVLIFAIASFLSAATFTAMKFTSPSFGSSKRQYLVPSGPIPLHLMLLILSRGQKINTMFSLSQTGPALLQLLYLSALTFENQADKILRYSMLEVSTLSGILHASLYLDSIILPYYTGLEALTMSMLSGECATCVCRRDTLVVGGTMVSYRGLSRTTVFVVATMCSRMLVVIFGEGNLSLLVKVMMEGISWLLIASDSIYLMIFVPQGGVVSKIANGGICVLILFSVSNKVCSFLACLAVKHHIQKKDLWHNNV